MIVRQPDFALPVVPEGGYTWGIFGPSAAGSLKQTQRVHVHQYGLLRNLFFFAERQQIRKDARELRALGGFQQELEAVLFLQPRQRRRGRAQDFHSARFLRGKKRRKLARPPDRIFDFRVAHQNAGQRRERRVVQQTPELQFPLEKREIILPRGELDRIVLGIIRFDQNFAGQRAAPGAPGNLRQKLKRALGGPKIRQTELRIRGNDSHQRDALEIVAFRNHLRADEDVDFPGSKIAQHLLVGALGADRVAIQARDFRVGEFFAEFFLELLGARAEKIDVFGSSTWGRSSARAA